MLPKKKLGFRKIVVKGASFNWRLDRYIDIRPATNRSNRLFVDVSYQDPWLSLPKVESLPDKNFEGPVTPSLVRNAIEYALAMGWDLEANNKLFAIVLKEDEFILSQAPEAG